MELQLVVAAVLGVLVGALGVVAFTASERGARRRRPELPAPPGHDPELPAGVADVLAVLGGPAVVLDVADEVVRATPAAFATGLVRGRSLVHPELLAMARAARRDGTTEESQLELPRGPLGRERVVLEVRVAPLGALHVLLLASDHTESVHVEEMRRDFLVNVSHELKTPVGAIGLLAEAMQEAAEDPVAVRRFAGRTAVESRRLTELVRDIIDLSQLQVRDPLAGASPVDVAAVVAEAVDRCKLTAESRDVQVDVARQRSSGAGDGEDVHVYGDREQLTMAVTNLVDNAVRYSEPGTRVVVGVSSGRGLVEVVVKDQGIGIPELEQERVFERFYRVDPARSRATGGTGLGLSIVKHVMSRHGGDVHLWSQPGAGSTFTLRLPDRASPRAALDPDAPPDAPPGAPPDPGAARVPGPGRTPVSGTTAGTGNTDGADGVEAVR